MRAALLQVQSQFAKDSIPAAFFGLEKWNCQFADQRKAPQNTGLLPLRCSF
jgi:hypothetical protein